MALATDLALHFHQVDFAYAEIPVLAQASFHLKKGEFAALVGPNGAGKSTVLKLILGLVRPKSGSVIVLDRDPPQASHLLGYVPQHASFDPAFPIRVKEVVRMGLVRGLERPPRNPQALEAAMAAARIEDLANRPFGQLSGGQRRRVLLARALISDPAMLLLDEPTANLDAESEERLYQVLADFKGLKTIILVSHDSDFVSSLTDAVYCLGDRHSPGRIVHHRTSPTLATGLLPLQVLHDTKLNDPTHCCTHHTPEES